MLQAIQNNSFPDDPGVLASMMYGLINPEAINSLYITKPFHEWVEGITLDGRPFTYDRHEYLQES